MLTLDLAHQVNTPNKVSKIKVVAINWNDRDGDPDPSAHVIVEVRGGSEKFFTRDLIVRNTGCHKLTTNAQFSEISDVVRVDFDNTILNAFAGLAAACDAAARANGGKLKAAETYLASIGALPSGTVA